LPSAAELLKQLAEAKPVTYKGVQVFVRPVGERVPTRKIRIYRQLPDRLRVESGEDFKQVLVMDGKHYWRVTPETARRRPPAGPPGFSRHLDADKLLRNYDVTVSGGHHVAGREAYVVSIAGKYPGRPSQTLWLDKETLFRLKVEKKDSAQKLVFSTRFEEISFPAELPEELFQAPENVEVVTIERRREAPPSFKTINEARAAIDFPLVAPAVLPRGFSLSSVQVIKYGRRPVKAVQLAYSDGLISISVFERAPRPRSGTTSEKRRLPRRSGESGERRQRERRFETVTHEGIKLQVGSRGGLTVVTRRLSSVSVTIIGELDRQELIEMAASLKVAEQAEAPVSHGGSQAGAD
jgi:outer membrane lipoprotein-sorting protein